MQRIHRFAAVGALMAVFALISTALAVASPRGAVSANRIGARAGTTSLPNTNIKGKPAKWSPKSLSGKSRGGGSSCTASQASFTITNKENKTEDFSWSGPNLTPGSYFIAPKSQLYDCVTAGYKGTITFKLKDGKKLKAKIS